MSPQIYTIKDIEKATDNFTKKIGQGGFGIVYDGVLNNIKVAVKVSDDTEDIREQWQNEIDILALISQSQSSSIVSLYGYGSGDGKLFLVLERLQQSVTDALKDKINSYLDIIGKLRKQNKLTTDGIVLMSAVFSRSQGERGEVALTYLVENRDYKGQFGINSKKLKALKEDLKIWNKEVFGDVGLRKKGVMADIGRLDEQEFQGVLSNEDRVQRDQLRADWDCLAHLDEISWRQKLLKWMGFPNEEADIREQMVLFYTNLYWESKVWRPDVDGLPFATIGEEDCRLLERNFDEEEGQFEKSLNATFIALIPKKPTTVNIKDFRPISLIGSIYKLLAKVLANRLRGVLDGLVSESQNAFGFEAGGSFIPVAVLTDELDIEKAYDQVNWNCLIHLLGRMGFGSKWQGWIRACISTVRFSVLVNGSPAGFFGSSRGLRQGDPLSPLLLLLMMEILKEVCVSPLLYADDTMLMCDAVPEQLMYIQLVLSCFEATTGLRGGSGEDSKHSLVRWDTICSPIDRGGLGIRMLVPLNRALLGKWLWRFGVEESRLWRQVVASRHGVVNGGWCTCQVQSSYGCGLWKGIMMGWDQFHKHLRFTVSRGDRVRLWHDCWCGDMALKDVFPNIFECASHKNAFLNEVMVRHNGRVVWNVSFMRNFNDWEMDSVVEFLTLIESKAPL
uniref:Reverse transcriptase domain-containing protein n=1 Tax=Fagus sylvatica TaxID=28930 RepID=A0A2N9FGG2_FAGSY